MEKEDFKWADDLAKVMVLNDHASPGMVNLLRCYQKLRNEPNGEMIRWMRWSASIWHEDSETHQALMSVAEQLEMGDLQKWVLGMEK